jgi:hypothetical protein
MTPAERKWIGSLLLLAACTPSATTTTTDRAASYQKSLDVCEKLGVTVGTDAGRDAGLSAYDTCKKEGGL